jgi:hypothetical protein
MSKREAKLPFTYRLIAIYGWVIGWVWEPLMDVTKTLRTGGEGLGVAPTTVDSDQAAYRLAGVL